MQEARPLLDNLVYYGIFRRSMDKALGEDVYYMQIFAPGILEMMVNQKEPLETHPEVGRAFDEYTPQPRREHGRHDPRRLRSHARHPGRERALRASRGVRDYERISHYLDKYDRFSVSPCSCRASRSSLGDAGHLEEDMCVQMGRGAEHYIRTGRAREITREQALEIIQRAEENGLMHGQHRGAGRERGHLQLLRLRLLRSARGSDVRRARCDPLQLRRRGGRGRVACGQCVETCPGNALKLGQKLCSTEDLTPRRTTSKLSETIHPKRSWNPDYRGSRGRHAHRHRAVQRPPAPRTCPCRAI